MMKNTAKNGLPMRFELRECVLSLALIYGFEKNEILAEMLFPNDDIRREQVVFIRIPKKHIGDVFEKGSFRLAIEVIKRYYKFIENDDEIIFFDTKKFRIYYQRLIWGREKKIILDKTIQYFRSSLVNEVLSEYMMYICLDSYKEEPFNNYWWYRCAKNPRISQEKYIEYVIAPKKEDNNIAEYGEIVIKKKKPRRVKIG